MLELLERLAGSYERLETWARRALFVRLLPAFAADRLTLVYRVRLVLRLLVPLAIAVTFAAGALMSPKVLNLAGLLFDLAGIARIFLDEEWERILQHYKDDARYPSGPPSHVMRELLEADDPMRLGDLEGAGAAGDMARHFHWQRGLVLVLVGFCLQFVAAALSD